MTGSTEIDDDISQLRLTRRGLVRGATASLVVLSAGGVGYIASAFVEYAFDAPTWLGDALTIPATIGEFWMIGYLLVIGLRPAAERPSRAHAEAAA